VSRKRLDSPCIKVCTLDENTGCCIGCFRTLEEIAGWLQMDDRERQIVYHKISKRKNFLKFETETSSIILDS
jgi:predicted Fe-S protein YdhL (DUF1289 family)